ncbi:unnamed protein product [Moneuplotes crassus]|uniref:Uncharacterized protein n=1 Tax=Euplotes crassus TaxID=5936 RepID=A0AAD1XEH9_EUPCR|nr:unnamed protein product [Moneuplotes crassus]
MDQIIFSFKYWSDTKPRIYESFILIAQEVDGMSKLKEKYLGFCITAKYMDAFSFRIDSLCTS